MYFVYEITYYKNKKLDTSLIAIVDTEDDAKEFINTLKEISTDGDYHIEHVYVFVKGIEHAELQN
jgi:PII-like signaling protein